MTPVKNSGSRRRRRRRRTKPLPFMFAVWMQCLKWNWNFVRPTHGFAYEIG